jgi:hypothetical protein
MALGGDRQLLIAPIAAAVSVGFWADSAEAAKGGLFSPTRSTELAKK